MEAVNGAEHAEQLSRVYSPVTWTVYDALDVSLQPRSPDWLHDRAAELLPPQGRVLDAGCRDAAHLIQLAQRHPDVSGVGLDPVPLHVERGRAAVTSAGLLARLSIVQGGMEALPDLGQRFDFVWCRDVLEQVADLPAALFGVAQVLEPTGTVLVFTTVATNLLEPREASMLGHHLGNVSANLSQPRLEDAFEAAGLSIVDRDSIGTEWREHAEAHGHPASTALLRLARLRRSQQVVVARHGVDIYHHIEANLHWEVYQLLGKLLPIVYTLRRSS